jgi:Conjugal transfer protein TraD
MRSLTERLRAFEQQKARLADTEAKLKLAEKRLQLRRCIKIGELVMKAGLSDLDEEMLYGGLLALARTDEAKRRQWRAEGAEALAMQKLSTENRRPTLLTFATYPSAETVAELRAQGFRFNRLLQHWEGLALFDDAEKLAERHDGVARIVEV